MASRPVPTACQVDSTGNFLRNTFITHDFGPLVGHFGLASWQLDGDTGVGTRVIGTLGYLVPE